MTTLRACFRVVEPETLENEPVVRPSATRPMPNASPAAKNLALAHHVERLIDRGLIADYTQAARMLGVSQPRMTMLVALVLLSPMIQEAILLGCAAPREKMLRRLARVACWEEQELVHSGLNQ